MTSRPAIVSLALGIGLATAVFTVANAVLLRDLPVVDQDRLVVLHGTSERRGMEQIPFPLDGAREVVRASRSLSAATWFLYNGATPATARLEDATTVMRLQQALVSGSYFDVLSARPMLGRALTPDDDASGAAPVLVVSHRAWQERFGGDPGIIGRRIYMHDRGAMFTIVGVMPPGLDYPRGADTWTPIGAAIAPTSLQYVSVNVLGRLAPGGTPAIARDEVTSWFHRDGASAFEREVRGVAESLPELVIGDTRPAVIAIAAAALLLLLITCVNVANLLLVGGLGRMREIAVRSALGATRARLVRQLLVEHAKLAAIGGALGVVVAVLAVQAFVAFAPAGLPRLEQVSVDGAALLGAIAITTFALLAFAVVPALLTSRVDVQEVLRSGLRQGAGRASRVGREVLVAAQVALALVVLSSAGVVTRSLWKLKGADLAFDPAQVVVAELSSGTAYPDAASQHAMLDRVIPAIASIPGLRDVSPVVSVPYASMRSWEGRPSAEGQTPDEAARNPYVDFEVVGPGFFGTLGLPIVEGRAFTQADRRGAPSVVILSASAARHYWPDGTALGRRVSVGGTPESPAYATVVGIVPDARYRDLRQPHAAIYFPIGQSFFPFAPSTLVIRANRTTGDIASSVRAVLAEQAPGVALAALTPFASLLEGPLAQPRMNAVLLAVFAAAALTLAGVGLFGVLATMVRQRRPELGIRMALGATAADIARLVVSRGVLLTLGGAVVGLVGAIAVNGLLRDLLFEVTPTDTATLVVVSVFVFAVALGASVIPAWAGARVQPGEALRS